MLNLTMMTLSILFVFMKHPIMLESILLAQTITTCLTMGLININYCWQYSYILFIIMIGGLLILFIYMTSIASNEKFKMSYILTFSFFIKIINFYINNSFLFFKLPK